MKIAAKTNVGFLIEATEAEVKDLMRSSGNKDPKPSIGDELPCRDFSAQIAQIKSIQESYDFKTMMSRYEDIGKALKKFDDSTSKLKS